MYHPLRIIKEKCQTVIRNQWQLLLQCHFQVQFYNIWDGQNHDDLYWYQFLKGRRLLDTDKTIAIFSVFGDRGLIDRVKADVKIFYSAENFKRGEYAQYKDNALGVSSIDLSMGLEVIDDPRYIRFPLWMDYIFPTDSTADFIRAKCQQLRFPDIDGKHKFCCMVASNGEGHLREDMFNRISLI